MKTIFYTSVLLLFLFSTSVHAQADGKYSGAMKLYNSGKYRQAVASLKKSADLETDPVANYLIGYALYKTKHFSEAAGYFKQAFTIDPDFSLEKAGLLRKAPKPDKCGGAGPEKEQCSQ